MRLVFLLVKLLNNSQRKHKNIMSVKKSCVYLTQISLDLNKL